MPEIKQRLAANARDQDFVGLFLEEPRVGAHGHEAVTLIGGQGSHLEQDRLSTVVD